MEIKKIIRIITLEQLLECFRPVRGFYDEFVINLSITFAPLIHFFFIKKRNKYLICRPRGGLNDTLNRIELCCRYALKYRRRLYIDTSKSRLWDSLFNYFILPNYIIPEKVDFIKYPASVYPDCLKNDIYNYESEPTHQGMKIKDGPYLQFDFNRNYLEDYLIYENFGGGELAVFFLKRIILNKCVRLHIASVINKLGFYAAVHIRNTDLKTEYKPFLHGLTNEIKHDVVVISTDSYEVQQYGKQLFGDRLILPISIPDLGGKALHNQNNLDTSERYNTCVDILTDLFILACSDKLYMTKVTGGFYSGFGILAMKLKNNKRLIKRLLLGV